MKRKFVAVIATGLFIFGIVAQASAINYTFDFVDDLYVSTDAPILGTFNINTFLTRNFGTQPFSIDNTLLVFNFSDDNNGDITNDHTETRPFSGNDESGYDRNQTVFKVDEAETAVVSVGGTSFSSSSNYYNEVISTGTQYSSRTHQKIIGSQKTWHPKQGWTAGYYTWDLVYETVVAQERTHLFDDISGFNGDFMLEFAADDMMRTSLMDDGLLDFTISSTFGDFKFTGATLVADINSTTAPVPEPTTILLLGTGLAIFFTSRLRRKMLS